MFPLIVRKDHICVLMILMFLNGFVTAKIEEKKIYNRPTSDFTVFKIHCQ